ncbi:hypothetical protein A8709_06245 [Paenibacillus pectinilyticus]|uniref:DUF1398 domain-containing protein n=1 Tax=Paenibacillus pectinilyticus TaxID=512399 RepID=A0A1C0ZTC7_9BACL|nr:DUF1398 family protein [Paenibacillus pectinilyticus]OCT11273.1 hypothetical protein A8709_06245 [Paenibacillus pectinilyticus]
MNVQEVKRISEVSKLERWPYPRTFQALIDAGVTSYRTEVADNFTVYMGEGDRYEDMNSAMAEKSEIADEFHGDEVKSGLVHHQQHRTPYADFLKDMAKAGVHYYIVDMPGRMITYTSGRPGESYAEAIPAFE